MGMKGSGLKRQYTCSFRVAFIHKQKGGVKTISEQKKGISEPLLSECANVLENKKVYLFHDLTLLNSSNTIHDKRRYGCFNKF